MKLPVLLGVLFILFTVGFIGGLWQAGFWKPIYVEAGDNLDSYPLQERARMELERLRKVASEMDSWGTDLKKRAEVLDQRESKLNKLEEDMKLERASLDKLNDQIEQYRKQMDARLVLVDASQDVNISQLAKVYTAMEPGNAAKVLASLPEAQTVQILRKMKEGNAAKIMGVWAAGGITVDKAVRMTTLLRVSIQPPSETP